jgi:6-phosphogluconate dehydrogenase
MDHQYDFGMVGLGVMGRNFLLNVADNGYSAAGLDLDEEKARALNDESGEQPVRGTTDKTEFVRWLKTPRRIMLLVPAGKAVDAVIQDLLPLLEPGDMIIDGGNSHYPDTDRRFKALKEEGIQFLGVGVSGGAEGARRGPSIMPGGEEPAYTLVKPILEAVSAKVKGEPCVTYLGKRSAGHYVKMVHNGIEYGLMQLIAESYDLLQKIAGAANEEIHRTFLNWNDGLLRSYLMEISADIFAKRDEETGRYLIDLIMDKAKQKGTGKWTSQSAMDLGIPVPTIDAAVSMRVISSFKRERMKASGVMPVRPDLSGELDKEQFKRHLEEALYFSFVVTYAQGMHLLAEASAELDYDLNLEEIARIWRGGCIIRADLLETIRKAFNEETGLANLMFSPYFQSDLIKAVNSVRIVVQTGTGYGIPLLGFSSALNYFQAFHTRTLPLNLVQAQRDYFGSHTYERIDKEGTFHTEW